MKYFIIFTTTLLSSFVASQFHAKYMKIAFKAKGGERNRQVLKVFWVFIIHAGFTMLVLVLAKYSDIFLV